MLRATAECKALLASQARDLEAREESDLQGQEANNIASKARELARLHASRMEEVARQGQHNEFAVYQAEAARKLRELALLNLLERERVERTLEREANEENRVLQEWRNAHAHGADGAAPHCGMWGCEICVLEAHFEARLRRLRLEKMRKDAHDRVIFAQNLPYWVFAILAACLIRWLWMK